MRVDALSAGVQAAPSEPVYFRFASVPDGDGEGSLRTRQLQQQVAVALAERNFLLAGAGQTPSLVISVRARISDPLTETDQISEPVYIRTGGVHRVVATPVRGPDGSVSFVYSTIWIPPRTDFVGFTNRNRNVTVFQKELTISARPYDGSARGSEEVWTVAVSARDSVSDLRAHLPYMLAAAMPYIGEQTEGQVVVRIRSNDEVVQRFRN